MLKLDLVLTFPLVPGVALDQGRVKKLLADLPYCAEMRPPC